MRSNSEVRGWFWWLTIVACGVSFVVALEPATASETRAAPASVAKAVIPSRAKATRVAWQRAERERMPPTSSSLPSELPALGEPSVRGLRRLAASEISAEMLVIARRILRERHGAPPGTEIAFESGGQNYVARIERHYHPEGGPVKPWGYHPGVSLLKVRQSSVVAGG